MHPTNLMNDNYMQKLATRNVTILVTITGKGDNPNHTPEQLGNVAFQCWFSQKDAKIILVGLVSLYYWAVQSQPKQPKGFGGCSTVFLGRVQFNKDI